METEGLFARIADIGDPDFLDEFVGPVGANAFDRARTPHAVAKMNTWGEAIEPCRRIAANFREIADARGPVSDRDDKTQFRDPAKLIVTLLAQHVLAAKEITFTIGEDLTFHANSMTPRAYLVSEMVNAVRDQWLFHRCDYCGGWHRIRQARSEGRGCITAAQRARDGGEAA
jgi:hypothetical protein